MIILFLDEVNIIRLGLNYFLESLFIDEELIYEIVKICKY